MASSENHLPFTPTGKEDWLTQVNKELKGKSVDTLDWELNERIRMEPIYTADEVPVKNPLHRKPGWSIGAYVDGKSNPDINAYALDELAGGAEALLFRLFRQPGPGDIAAILKDVQVDMISLHCALRYPGQDPAELFRDLVRYLRKQGYDLTKITGSVDFDPLLDWSDPPFPPLIRLMYFVQRWMPGFRVLQVNAAGFNNGAGTADDELALAIAKGTEYLAQLQDRGYPPGLAHRHLKFSFTVGTSFYTDVAKLRALRILWANVLRGFGVENPAPTQIAAHSDIGTLTNERDENLLRLTTQALAAVTGGADSIFLAPAEGPDHAPTPFGRRMARNIQHLLRLESGLGQLPDPAAGSFYLEKLTDALVESAWNRFKNIEAQGGFALATVL
jgi:methylmalonyl-CoA mutase